MTATTHRKTETPTTGSEARQLRRLLAVATTLAVIGLSWIVFEVGFGLDLRAPAFDDQSTTQAVTAGSVIGTTLIATLLGWLLLVALERWINRVRLAWHIAALMVTAVSLGGPLSGSGIPTTHRLALTALHLIVASVYIPLMGRAIEQQRGVTR